jgi:hypothetical protein
MLNIMRAIARLLGLQTQPTDNPVPPTQTVGRVSKAPTAPRGNKRSAEPSTLQPQPATKKRSSKPKAVQSTTQASSRKAAPKPAQTTSGKRGRPRKTPV